jgi:PAS domain S-box-containing protein
MAAMDKSPLELIRRQIREAEDRHKMQPAGKSQDSFSLSGDTSQKLKPDSGSMPANGALLSSNRANGFCAAQQGNPSALLNLSNDAFILMNANGEWEFANHHLRNWLGYAEDEFQRINLTEIFEAEDIKRLQDSFLQWLSGDKPIRQAPFNLRSRTRERIHVLLSTHSWLDNEGKPPAYLVLENMDRVRALLAALDIAARPGN